MKNIKAIIFDAYGTLFDVNSAAEKCKSKIGDKWENFANYWRKTQLEYTWPNIFGEPPIFAVGGIPGPQSENRKKR